MKHNHLDFPIFQISKVQILVIHCTVDDQNQNVQKWNYAKIRAQQSYGFRHKFVLLNQTEHIKTSLDSFIYRKNYMYSKRPKFERSDFRQDRFGWVSKSFGIRTKLFGFRTQNQFKTGSKPVLFGYETFGLRTFTVKWSRLVCLAFSKLGTVQCRIQSTVQRAAVRISNLFKIQSFTVFILIQHFGP